MFNKISSITLAVLLFFVFMSAVLGSSQSANQNIGVFMASLFILIVAAFIINLRRIGLSWPHLLLPTLYLLAVGSCFVVITSPTIRVLFLIIASIAYYFVELDLGHESHFLQNIFLLSVFGLFLGIFAVQFYLHLSTRIIVPIIFVITYLLTVQGFAGFSLPIKKYFYLLIALILAEASWGLILWPTHYVVNTVVIFSIFYLLWIFSFSAFFGKLTKKKVYLQLALVVFVLTVTLSSASWMPLAR